MSNPPTSLNVSNAIANNADVLELYKKVATYDSQIFSLQARLAQLTKLRVDTYAQIAPTLAKTLINSGLP